MQVSEGSSGHAKFLISIEKRLSGKTVDITVHDTHLTMKELRSLLIDFLRGQ